MSTTEEVEDNKLASLQDGPSENADSARHQHGSEETERVHSEEKTTVTVEYTVITNQR